VRESKAAVEVLAGLHIEMAGISGGGGGERRGRYREEEYVRQEFLIREHLLCRHSVRSFSRPDKQKIRYS
jgi:hypothetical protein